MSLPLFVLFLAAFTFGTAEFVIAGILPEVAAGLSVSIPVAGFVITLYALGIAIGAPILSILTKSVPRRTLIIALCVIFTIGQAACALAPNYEMLLVARVFSSVVHGCFFGIAPIVAIRLVPPNRAGSAVALVLAGLTVSNILGVPGGTAIGNAFGWRMTFWAVGALGLLATLGIVFFLPHNIAGGAGSGSMRAEFKALGRQQIITALGIVILVMIGQYSLFTYIAPLLREVTGVPVDVVPWVLLLFGVGSTIGVFIGGRLADWKLMPSLIVIMALQGTIYALLGLSSSLPWVMAVVVVFWGGVNFAFGSPVQTRVLQWAGDAPNLASALIPPGFNIGIAIGASLGAGVLSAGHGYAALPWIGVVAMILALSLAVLSFVWEKRAGQVPPGSTRP